MAPLRVFTRMSGPSRSLRGTAALLLIAGLLGTGSAAAQVAPADLTRGASTIVPASMNPGFKDAFGDPYVVRTRVTALRFHNGTISSRDPGGLTTVPHPRLKELGGVSYYQVTGELSGIGHSPIGYEYVYGPIDARGVNQSTNRNSPRYGLPGIVFRLIYPPEGWNGKLIYYRPGGDGGRGSGHYLFQSIIDEVALVNAGYAVFVTLGGGTTPRDSNPDSTSGRFWKLAPPFWANRGPYHPDFFRAAAIDSSWRERLIPDSEPGRAWWEGQPEPIGTPIGSARFVRANELDIQDHVPTLRDHVIAAKNLLQLLARARPTSTGLVTWSRSTLLALGMNLGRTGQESPSMVAPVDGRSPRTGGDYVTPYVPSSGRVVDWFLAYSGVNIRTVPTRHGPAFTEIAPDPRYPIAAPMTYVTPEVDARDLLFNGYLAARDVMRALPGSSLPDRDPNAHLRLYGPRHLTHLPRDVWFAGPFNGGRTFYEHEGAGVNHEGLGVPLPAWMDELEAHNDGWYGERFSPRIWAGLVRSTGLLMRLIDNADRWATTDEPPPVSRIPAHLIERPAAGKRVYPYPIAEECDPEEVFGGDESCLDSLERDSQMDLGDVVPFDTFEARTMRELDASRLRYSTQPLTLPDGFAPLGVRLFTTGPVFLRLFIQDELRARYGDHEGYVAAVRRAVEALIEQRLYDPEIGALEIQAAQESDVLAGSG